MSEINTKHVITIPLWTNADPSEVLALAIEAGRSISRELEDCGLETIFDDEWVEVELFEEAIDDSEEEE
jgi:hypothetical protein